MAAPGPGLAAFESLGSFVYIGLAILGWGGFAAYRVLDDRRG